MGTFASSRTVNNIFKLSVQNGNQTSFQAFPHIPGRAMARKTGLEEILKRLQGMNKQIRYQIRLGKDDIKLFMKNHVEYQWKPYRKVEIHVIDPNGNVPKWDLTKNDAMNTTNNVNSFNITKQPGKRGPVESLERRASKRSNIDDWQVCEFIWAFLEGTKTTPEYKDLTWEEVQADDEVNLEEENRPGEVNSAENGDEEVIGIHGDQ